MITKTANEIIEGAKAKAGVFNCDFLGFLTVTNELNNAFREVYSEIARSDNDYFVKTIRFEDERCFKLPKDLFIIKGIYIELPSGCLVKLEKEEYSLENGVFRYLVPQVGTIVIKYVPDPPTLTAPRESEEINIEAPEEWGKMTDLGVYYKRDGLYYYYSFENASEEEIEESEYKTGSTTFLKHTITIDYDKQTITAVDADENEEDWTEIFTRENFGDFTEIVFDSPYCFVTYADGHILVFSQLIPTLWNIKASSGHDTLGKVHAIKTDDRTLYGVIYEDEDGYFYRASFVPDTVLNYPSNALFNYLEVILARLFLSMNGMESNYVNEDLYRNIKSQFYRELQMDHNSVAVRKPTLRRFRRR